MSAEATAARNVCPNCASTLAGHESYCPGCGQEVRLQPPTLRGFLSEFLGQYIALEGSLWRTLAALLWRPGRLTREYLEGRRRRYVLPMRLYLSASFLFFLIVQWLGAGAPVQFDLGVAADLQGRPVRIMDAPERVPELAPLLACAQGRSSCGALTQAASKAALRVLQNVERDGDRIEQRVADAMPYAVFVLLPAFAGLLATVYRSRRMPYGGHVVFSLHLHAFWFLALLAVAMLPATLQSLAWLLLPAYTLWAMRHVHGGRWLPTLARGAVLALGYLTALVLLTAAIVIGAAWAA